MSLFNVFDISGSGMASQALRMNLTASNMANANSVAGSEDEAYKSRHPVFSALMQDVNSDGSTGVQSLGVVESQAAHEKRYEPEHPLADEEGYVYASNVNAVEEMANMISASRSYRNNIEVLNTSKTLLLETLKLGE
ncbi:flagellar basal body rod protein FlgC [Granulosicoccaceae sp. 1_MG-2023]|nr:flagellar basal body rod protein FlgC [Granulosicoccaceae sp. 1_MG-2023]